MPTCLCGKKIILKNFLYKLTHWETWHYLAKYIPIAPVWLWYCIRARSLWFFTSSNPTIEFGGFEGETKSEMYAQLPQGSFPESILITAAENFDQVTNRIKDSGIAYPFAAKPDAGMMGFMFRIIKDQEALKSYHGALPVNYIIQTLVEYPIEVSVFYYRFPNQQSGCITGFIKKEFLEVVGDGISTLSELIDNYERVRFIKEEIRLKHIDHLNRVLKTAEIYILSYALNLSRGGKLISLAHEIDKDLLKVFDDISLYSKHFYYGRYDIKCASIADLKQGKNYSILEFNGAGAEPHHAYGNGNNLFQAYGIFIHHWKILFQISHYNHKHGYPHWSYLKGRKYLKKGKENFRLIRSLDRATPVM